jgi:hypothetical protein
MSACKMQRMRNELWYIISTYESNSHFRFWLPLWYLQTLLRSIGSLSCRTSIIDMITTTDIYIYIYYIYQVQDYDYKLFTKTRPVICEGRYFTHMSKPLHGRIQQLKKKQNLYPPNTWSFPLYLYLSWLDTDTSIKQKLPGYSSFTIHHWFLSLYYIRFSNCIKIWYMKIKKREK